MGRENIYLVSHKRSAGKTVWAYYGRKASDGLPSIHVFLAYTYTPFAFCDGCAVVLGGRAFSFCVVFCVDAHVGFFVVCIESLLWCKEIQKRKRMVARTVPLVV